MKKYVKTDNSIFEYNDDFKHKFDLSWWQINNIENNVGNIYLDGKTLAKVISNNLSELCDYFVIVWNTGNRWVISNGSNLGDFAWKEVKEVLGSIWVGTTLVPVAKYNTTTKEFELINQEVE